MFNFILFTLFQTILFILSSSRSDANNFIGFTHLVNALYGVTCNSNTGSQTNYCPDGTYVYGFKVLDYATYGIINIIFDCRQPIYDSSTAQWTTLGAQTISFSDIGTIFSSWSLRDNDMVHCTGNNGKDFVRGYYLRLWCPITLSDAQGIVEIKMQCSYNDIIQPIEPSSSHITASWTGYSYCRPGFVACGYTMSKFHQQANDRVHGAIDIKFECCRICEVSEGFYLDTGSWQCEYCDINCKECSGSASHCTKCYNGYTLSGANTCDPTMPITVEAQNFFNFFLPSGWSINSGFMFLNICAPYTLMGGDGDFNKNKYVWKTFSGLGSHSAIAIFVQIFKVGDWGTGGMQILVNGVVKKTLSNFVDVPTSLYYKDICDYGHYIQNSNKVVIMLSHTSSSIQVKIQPTYTGSGYWAFSRFQLVLLSCDNTCLTCVGPAANQCSSCDTGRFLTIGSTCELICPIPYYGDTSTNECIAQCPDNYYTDNVDRICYNPCPSGKFGDPLTGFCVDTCPDGMFKDIASSLCKYCDFKCLKCDTSASDCIDCAYSWLGVPPSCSLPTCK